MEIWTQPVVITCYIRTVAGFDAQVLQMNEERKNKYFGKQ